MKNGPFPYYEVEYFYTFLEMLEKVKSKYQDKILFRTKKKQGEQIITYEQFYDDVLRLSSFFITESQKKRQKIAVIGEDSYEWILTYLAVCVSGNIIVPLDKELSVSDISEQLNDCECKTIVNSASYDDIVDELREKEQDIRSISMRDLRSLIEKETALSYAEPDPDAMTAIIYTSGTTGKSKGVMLSQRNICADVCHCCENIRFVGRTIAMLPFHHTFAMLVTVLMGVYSGVETLICPSMKNLMSMMQEFKPTYLNVVPAIIESIDRSITSQIENSGKKNILAIADKLCKICEAIGLNNVRKRIFKKIRESFGGEIDYFISGGAPIDQKIIDRFETYGIRILNGYGISECSPVVSVNRRYYVKAGSVGQPMHHIEVRIDQPDEDGEGEICVNSDVVMLGYYNNPEETAAVLKDGWFHTGDKGRIDNDGFIYITGRIKNLIILSNGKNVSPEELEILIGRISGVEEVLVCEKNNQIVAEIYPSESVRNQGVNLHDIFMEQIDRLNEALPPYKNIADIIITDTAFEKTTTKKIKRKYQ